MGDIEFIYCAGQFENYGNNTSIYEQNCNFISNLYIGIVNPTNSLVTLLLSSQRGLKMFWESSRVNLNIGNKSHLVLSVPSSEVIYATQNNKTFNQQSPFLEGDFLIFSKMLKTTKTWITQACPSLLSHCKVWSYLNILNIGFYAFKWFCVCKKTHDVSLHQFAINCKRRKVGLDVIFSLYPKQFILNILC